MAIFGDWDPKSLLGDWDLNFYFGENLTIFNQMQIRKLNIYPDMNSVTVFAYGWIHDDPNKQWAMDPTSISPPPYIWGAYIRPLGNPHAWFYLISKEFDKYSRIFKGTVRSVYYLNQPGSGTWEAKHV